MDYFIYQSCHNDCCLTCTKILMANLSKNKSYLYISNPKEKDEPYSLLEIVEFSKKYGLNLKAFRSEDKSLTSSSISFPCIINQTLGDGELHSIVIKKIKKDSAYVLDPSKGIIKKKIQELENNWDGRILEVENFSPEPLDIKRPKILNVKDESILILFQVLSLVSCFVAMYFFDGKQKIILPLIIFMLFLLFQFLHQFFLIHCLKKFDNKYVDSLFDENEIYRREKYQILHNYKTLMFSTPSQLVSSLITSVFIEILLLLNLEKTLLACVGLLIIAAVDGLIIDPYFQRRKDELDSNEYSLLKSNFVQEDYVERMKKQSNNSYNFSSMIFIKKISFIFITLFFDLIVLMLTSNLTLSNILFYFFLLYFLFENLDDCMLFFNRFNLMNRTKERFIFYFKEKI